MDIRFLEKKVYYLEEKQYVISEYYKFLNQIIFWEFVVIIIICKISYFIIVFQIYLRFEGEGIKSRQEEFLVQDVLIFQDVGYEMQFLKDYDFVIDYMVKLEFQVFIQILKYEWIFYQRGSRSIGQVFFLGKIIV